MGADDKAFMLAMEARDILKQGWCQGALAKKADGIITDPDNPQAVCWCPEGAIDLARSRCDPFCTDEWEDPVGEVWSVLTALCDEDLGEEYEDGAAVWIWNDRPERTQAEAVQMMASVLAPARGIRGNGKEAKE